ncbi:MAG: YceI family protein [Gammaproteobacteria bacterium]|nr:YceI family protein [Sideroxydans sp.]MBU3903279.1 YceI family protein [Gammaproteobacteria bacterium]MBU4045779.1 YceI family protein [Gammaproteobacteria bacterium]
MFGAIVKLAVAFVLMSVGVSHAVEYRQVQANESTVMFGYTQMGVSMEGKFSRFTAQLAFDPAKLKPAQAKIEINIASIDTGVDEANEEVVGKQWFNAQTFPTASFVSTGMKSLGGDRYEASGQLSIKGTTRDVVVPVTFSSAGARGQFDGVLNIKRLDYAIGEGAWSDVGTVADEIQIKFHFVVTAAPNKK